jgi:hypothetical protein
MGRWPIRDLCTEDLTISGHPAFQVTCEAVPTVDGKTWQERVRTVGFKQGKACYVLIAGCREDRRTESITKAFGEFFASVAIVEEASHR